MDFGILLKAIGFVAIIFVSAGAFIGWIGFVTYNIHNYFMATIISILPSIVALIIIMYHVFQQS